MQVTLRNELIDSNFEIIKVKNENLKGTISHGLVVEVHSEFILISFFNKIYGRIYRSDLNDEEKKMFATLVKGQIIVVSVLNVVKTLVYLSLNTVCYINFKKKKN
jgi:ribosomal protein S1